MKTRLSASPLSLAFFPFGWPFWSCGFLAGPRSSHFQPPRCRAAALPCRLFVFSYSLILSVFFLRPPWRARLFAPRGRELPTASKTSLVFSLLPRTIFAHVGLSFPSSQLLPIATNVRHELHGGFCIQEGPTAQMRATKQRGPEDYARRLLCLFEFLSFSLLLLSSLWPPIEQASFTPPLACTQYERKRNWRQVSPSFQPRPPRPRLLLLLLSQSLRLCPPPPPPPPL